MNSRSTRKSLPDDHQAWIAERMRVNRALFGDARMEDPPVPDPQAGLPKPGDPPADPPKPPKTFSQDEVTAISTREKAEGKRAAEQALATELGVPIDEAKKILTAHKEREDSVKTEAERAKEAAEEAKREAEATKADAAKELFEARLERAFARAGLDFGTKDEDKAKADRVRRMVTAEAGASYEDVLADVEKIKADFPTLFAPAPDDKTRRAPGSDPKGRPPAPNGGEDKYAAGMERAKARRSGFSARVERAPADTKT